MREGYVDFTVSNDDLFNDGFDDPPLVVGRQWSIVLFIFLYVSGFLCECAFFDRYGIQETGEIFLKTQYIHAGILFLLFPVSILIPFTLKMVLKVRDAKLKSEPKFREAADHRTFDTGPDQVWCADITYIPMRHGFMYLMAVMDWWSRFVLAWELSNTLEAAFCVQAWQLALARGNQPPLIANTDQGAQFTSADYVEAVEDAGVLVSMDGRGRWMDNRFVERLWRSLKYEDIYLRGYEHGLELRQGVGRWFGDYNDYRPHQALGYATPAEVYRAPESHGAKPASWA